jgi:DNA-nicking Smr family endonuclease
VSRRKGPRNLRPEEAALWEVIAARTQPLHPKRTTAIPASPASMTEPAPKAPPQIPGRDAPLASFRIGEKAATAPLAHDVAPPLSASLAAAPVAMDRKAHRKLTRGKLVPEARIDLHGMTLAAAHPTLLGFMADAHARGLRLVLVITGKGKVREDGGPIPSRTGVLRHHVPQWLTSGILRPLVLQVAEAHRSHGGSGAFYVYLRRRK